MDETHRAPPEITVEEEITRVLAAEGEARDAVARCREDGAGIVAQAREEARRITRRTEERITRLRDAMRSQVQYERNACDKAAGELWTMLPAADAAEARMQRALQSLAPELTGAPRARRRDA